MPKRDKARPPISLMLRRNIGQRRCAGLEQLPWPVGHVVAAFFYVGAAITHLAEYVGRIRRTVEIKSGKRAHGSDWSGSRHFGAQPRGGCSAREAESARRRGGAGAEGAQQRHQLEAPGAHLPRHRRGDCRRRVGDRGGARRRAFLVVGGARDARRHRRHRRLAASVRRRHPRRHPLHAVRQPQAQRAGVRLAGGVSHSDDDLPLPPASPGAPPVRQRSRARPRHQPAARERPLARLSDHACRDPVVAAEAAMDPQPLPLHDHPRPLQLHSGERTIPMPIPSGPAPSGRCAPASSSPSALR